MNTLLNEQTLPLFVWGVYLFIMNIVAFGMMGIDKSRARKNRYRISEKALFVSALLGGSGGAIVGMRVFHHKTKHWYFRYGMPVILALQLALVCYIKWGF